MIPIEAVTVCVNYSDFLAETIPVNRVHFKRWVIVTSPDDHATQDLCHRQNLKCVVTRDFTRNGDPFNKGRAIERGLAMLGHDSWLLHLDADIALPGDYLESVSVADLDPSGIYGVDRIMIHGWERWQKIKPSLRRGWHCHVPAHEQIGARWADVDYGYVPIGFHQLWHQSADHRNGIRQRRYSDHHNNAARADVQFGLQWDRRDRHLIPEIFVAHLESEAAPLGANWKGRRTAPFGPCTRPKPPVTVS